MITMPSQNFYKGLEGMGAWFAGKGPSYEIAKTDRLKAEQEREKEDRRRRKLGLLNAGDYLANGDLRGAVDYINQTAEQRLSQGLDAKEELEFAKRLQSIQTPQQLNEAVSELQMMQRRAVREGLVQPTAAETGYTSVITGSDGRRYGIPKANPDQGYVPINSPEGVTFDSGGQTINVNTGTGNDNPFFSSATENATSTLNAFRESAQGANSRLRAIRALKGMDISTGFGTQARTNLARLTNFFFGEGAGDVFSDEVPAAQAFNALSQKMVNEELNLAKGPQTEGDAQRARSTVASLDKEQDANKFLLSYYEGLAMREQERDAFFRSRVNIGPNATQQQNLAEFQKAEDEWMQFKNETPLVATRQPSGKILTYAGTRIPMVYYDFEKMFLQKNGDQLGGTMQEKRQAARQAWREANGIQ